MAYTLRTKDNAGDTGRAADQNESVDNDILFNAQHLSPVTSWDPDKPPASASAYDEEFITVGGFTEVDPDAVSTWTYGEAGAKASVVTHADISINGIYRALPAGDFSIMTYAAISSRELAQMKAGLAVWEDATNNTKKIGAYGLFRDNTAGFPIQLQAYEFTDYDTASASKVAAATFGYGSGVYLRMRRTGTNYYLDFSTDGYGWRTPNADAAVTWSFTPTHMGLFVDNNNTGQTMVARFKFFRYIGSDLGLGGILNGCRG